MGKVLNLIHDPRQHTAIDFLQSSLPFPPIWKIFRVHGSIIGIDLGSPDEETEQSPVYLAIEMCDWILCHGDDVILDCIVTDDNAYDSILPSLVGKKILNIEQISDDHEIKVTLEDNYYFLLTENKSYGEDSDLFFVVQRGGKPSVSYTPDKGFNLED